VPGDREWVVGGLFVEIVMRGPRGERDRVLRHLDLEAVRREQARKRAGVMLRERRWSRGSAQRMADCLLRDAHAVADRSSRDPRDEDDAPVRRGHTRQLRYSVPRAREDHTEHRDDGIKASVLERQRLCPS
jgi:hypothetical protein